MRWLLGLLDRQADWVHEHATPQNQRRLGVLSIWVGVLFGLYAPFTNEPLLVYVMSVLAIVVGGIGVIVAAVPTE